MRMILQLAHVWQRATGVACARAGLIALCFRIVEPTAGRLLVDGRDIGGLGLDVLRGELSHSAKPFERDPYGCAQPERLARSSGRNPFRRSVAAGYAQSCAALAPLLAHCEPSLYAGALPWSTRVGDDEDDGVPRASGLYRRLQR